MGFQVLDTLGRIKGAQTPSEFTLTTTGNIDDLDFLNADLIRFNNASLSTLRGLKAGYAGQRVSLVSIGAGQVDLAHQNANSAIGNRLLNLATSANTSLAAATGTATYQYDGTTLRWRLIAHEQGAAIVIPFNSGDFTGSGTMTVTVASGDVGTNEYILRGKSLVRRITLNTFTIGGVPSTDVRIEVAAGGFVAASRVSTVVLITPSALPEEQGRLIADAGTSYVRFSRFAGAAWVAGADLTYAEGVLEFRVT